MTSRKPGAKTIHAAIKRAVGYLIQVQRPDGGFDSYSSPSTGDFEKAFTYQTTFVPSLILTALSGLRDPGSDRVKLRLAEFLKAQASPQWSFNYWSRTSPERHKQPYPDDLDDTCCALIGLVLYDASSVDAGVLAAFVKLLLATETQAGGPYRTWLVPPDSPAAWRDTDLAVNANITYLLSLVSRPLPNLISYLEQAITSERLTSPYYASSYPLIYYLARTYKGPLVGQLLAQLQQLQTGDSQPTPLKAALLLSSSLRLGAVDNRILAAQLLAEQNFDGSWPAAAFCLDPARHDVAYYNGSESLTTALAIESLQLFLSNLATEDKPLTVPPADHRDQNYINHPASLLAAARRDCRYLASDLSAGTMNFLTKLANSPIGPEIIGLPQAFNRSLVRPLDKSAQPMLQQLGLANLYGWAAYTIFDDFLDEEGQPDMLPIATLVLRRSLAGFATALPSDSGFQALANQTFDIIDGANAWELAHCRYQVHNQQIQITDLPDYGNLMKLAERSLGHSLAPLAILLASGTEPDDKLFKAIQQAFNHYLIARQLNDDAHDWQADLRNGHITYVVARLLADAGVEPGRYSWTKLLPMVQKTFWHTTLPVICHDMGHQTELGRQGLVGLPGLKPQNTITDLLDKIDASIAETLATQRQTKSFLAHYQAMPEPAR